MKRLSILTGLVLLASSQSMAIYDDTAFSTDAFSSDAFDFGDDQSPSPAGNPANTLPKPILKGVRMGV